MSVCVQLHASRCRSCLARRVIRGKMPVGEASVYPMGNRPTIDGRRTTPSGFARLLTRLHHDPDRAGAEYERLRRRPREVLRLARRLATR